MEPSLATPLEISVHVNVLNARFRQVVQCNDVNDFTARLIKEKVHSYLRTVFENSDRAPPASHLKLFVGKRSCRHEFTDEENVFQFQVQPRERIQLVKHSSAALCRIENLRHLQESEATRVREEKANEHRERRRRLDLQSQWKPIPWIAAYNGMPLIRRALEWVVFSGADFIRVRCVCRQFRDLVDCLWASRYEENPAYWFPRWILRQALLVSKTSYRPELSPYPLSQHLADVRDVAKALLSNLDSRLDDEIPASVRCFLPRKCDIRICSSPFRCWRDVGDFSLYPSSCSVLCCACNGVTWKCLFCDYATSASSLIAQERIRVHQNRRPPVCPGDKKSPGMKVCYCCVPSRVLDAEDFRQHVNSQVTKCVHGAYRTYRRSSILHVPRQSLWELISTFRQRQTRGVGVEELDGGGDELLPDVNIVDEDDDVVMRSSSGLYDEIRQEIAFRTKNRVFRVADVLGGQFSLYYDAYIEFGRVQETIPRECVIMPRDLDLVRLREEGFALLNDFLCSETNLSILDYRRRDRVLRPYQTPEESNLAKTFLFNTRSEQYWKLVDALHPFLTAAGKSVLPKVRATLQEHVSRNIPGFSLKDTKEKSSRARDSCLSSQLDDEGTPLPIEGAMPLQDRGVRRRRQVDEDGEEATDDVGDEGVIPEVDEDEEEGVVDEFPQSDPLPDIPSYSIEDVSDRTDQFDPVPSCTCNEYEVSHHIAKQNRQGRRVEKHELWQLKFAEMLQRSFQDELFRSRVRWVLRERDFVRCPLDSKAYRVLYYRNLDDGCLTFAILLYVDGTQPYKFRVKSVSNVIVLFLNLDSCDLQFEMKRHLVSFVEGCARCQRFWKEQAVSELLLIRRIIVQFGDIYLRVSVHLFLLKVDGKEALGVTSSFGLSQESYDCANCLHRVKDLRQSFSAPHHWKKSADLYTRAWCYGLSIFSDSSRTRTDRLTSLADEVERKTAFKFYKVLKLGGRQEEQYYLPYNPFVKLYPYGFDVFSTSNKPWESDHTLVLRLAQADLEAFLKICPTRIRHFALDQMDRYRSFPKRVPNFNFPPDLFNLSSYSHDCFRDVLFLFPYLFCVVPELFSTRRTVANGNLLLMYEILCSRSVVIALERREIRTIAVREFLLAVYRRYCRKVSEVSRDGMPMSAFAFRPTRHWEWELMLSLPVVGILIRGMRLEMCHQDPKRAIQKSNHKNILRDAVISSRREEELARAVPYFSVRSRMQRELSYLWSYDYSFELSSREIPNGVEGLLRESCPLTVPPTCSCDGVCSCLLPKLVLRHVSRVKEVGHTMNYSVGTVFPYYDVTAEEETFAVVVAPVLCCRGSIYTQGSTLLLVARDVCTPTEIYDDAETLESHVMLPLNPARRLRIVHLKQSRKSVAFVVPKTPRSLFDRFGIDHEIPESILPYVTRC